MCHNFPFLCHGFTSLIIVCVLVATCLARHLVSLPKNLFTGDLILASSKVQQYADGEIYSGCARREEKSCSGMDGGFTCGCH